jgi:hypothetical protein
MLTPAARAQRTSVDHGRALARGGTGYTGRTQW